MNKHSLANILTFSGAVPFIVCALLTITSIDLPYIDVTVSDVMIGYGAVIASFIAGIHWGLYLFKSSPINLFVASNVITLIAWASLYFSAMLSALILVGCFVLLLLIDKQLVKHQIIEDWFYSLRLRISAIVISALLVFSVFSA